MSCNPKVMHNEYDELFELEKYMESFKDNSQRVHKRFSVPPPKKKFEECPECDMKFLELKDLTEHFSAVHDDDSEEEDELSSIASFLKTGNTAAAPANAKLHGNSAANFRTAVHSTGMVKPQTSQLNKKVFQGASTAPKVSQSPLTSKIEATRTVQKVTSSVNSSSHNIPQISDVPKTSQNSTVLHKISQKATQKNTQTSLNKPSVNSYKIVQKVSHTEKSRNSQSGSPSPVAIHDTKTVPGISKSSILPVMSPKQSTQTLKQSYQNSKLLIPQNMVGPNVNQKHPSSQKEMLAEQYRLEVQRRIEVNTQQIMATQSSFKLQSVATSRQSANISDRQGLSKQTSSPSPSAILANRKSVYQKIPSSPIVPMPLTLRFIPDSVRILMKDVGTAVVPASSTDPFLNSFFAFCHDKTPEKMSSPAECPVITYEKADQGQAEEVMEKNEEVEVLENDPLLEHIESSGLPLRMRRPTLSDGNCWWDAVADQVELFDIADMPRDHGDLRREVCDSLMELPQTPVWIQNFFNNSKKNFRKFIGRHRRMGTWTDNLGIMCQATALFLGRNIHIVGTANRGQEQSFTKLEAGEEADKLPPFYIGYYQDKHYQSLEKVEPTETTEKIAEEPVTMGGFIDLLLEKVIEEVHVRSLRPKKKCKVMQIKPFKGPTKTAEELEREKICNKKIDSMLEVLNRRIKAKDNNERLEIFQNLKKLDTIMEFYQVSQGGIQRSVTGMKDDLENEVETVEDEPEPEPEIAEVSSTKSEEKGKNEVEQKPPAEPVTHILDVFKCNKCNHAFEKINLFVKHFIKVHKDVIDANKNSSSFSFSNFWTKMKVRASVKKKNNEDQATEEKKPEEAKPIAHEVKPTTAAPTVKKPKKKLSIIDELESLNIFDFKKPPPPRTDNEFETTLAMSCESEAFTIPRIMNLSEEDVVDSSLEFATVDQLCYQNVDPEDFQSAVYFSEEAVDVDAEIVPEMSDKYQMIPVSEIKQENPFEDLPFVWKYDDNAQESFTSQLEDVVDVYHEENVLGVTSESVLASLEILACVLENVESIVGDIYKTDDVEEMFNEEFHSRDKTSISHQVYIKDFAWIPLEDQFLDCPDFEQEDISKLFDIKKLRSESEKMCAVKTLLLTTENDRDVIKGYISKIVGKRFIPKEADHQEIILAKAKYIKFDHNYLPSNKSKKLASMKPNPNVVQTLKRMRSKVEIHPATSRDHRKPSFVGTRPPRRIINNNLVIYVDKDTGLPESKPRVSKFPMGRSGIQIFPLGMEAEAPVEYLDKFLRKQSGEPDSDAEPVDEVPAASQNDLNTEAGSNDEINNATVESEENERINILNSLKELDDTRKRKNEEKSEDESIKKSKVSKCKKRTKDPHMDTSISLENKSLIVETEINEVKEKEGKEDKEMRNVRDTVNKGSSIEDAWKSVDEFLDKGSHEFTETACSTSVSIPSVSSVSTTVSTSSVSIVIAESSTAPSPDSNYESQLTAHLDSLREPVELGPSVSVKEVPGPPVSYPATAPTAAATPSIKLEPVEQEGSETVTRPEVNMYNIKTEALEQALEAEISIIHSAPPVSVKQEVDVYGLYGGGTNCIIPLKSESVKSEPVELEECSEVLDDDDDIQILSDGDQGNVQDLCDVVTNIVRCGECFKSFISNEELTNHKKTHVVGITEETSRKERFDENMWLTPAKEAQISCSPFPVIRIQQVPIKGHGYIYPKSNVISEEKEAPEEKLIIDKVQAEIKISSAEPKIEEKVSEKSLEKNLTVLQALDSLFQPSKKAKPSGPQVDKPANSASSLQKPITKVDAKKGIVTKKGGTGKEKISAMLTCQVCWKVSCASMLSMRKHLTFHPHNQCLGKVNICSICDEKFDQRDPEFSLHVEKHMLEMRKSKNNRCVGCLATFKSSDELINHVKDMHETRKCFPCSICREQFDRRKKLLLHLDTIHSNTTYTL